jgi:hypothetical protein
LFICLFGYLSFSNYLVKTWETQVLADKESAVLGFTFTVLTFPLFSWVIWAVHKLLEKFSWRWIVTSIASISLFVTTIYIVFSYQLWSLGIFIHPQPDAWVQVGQWARDNTTRDAVFISPPDRFGVNEPEWRVIAERSKVVGLADLAEIALIPDYLPEWQERFNKLAPGAAAQFNYNFFDNQQVTHKAFYSLSTADLLQAACDYHVAYLVVESGQPRNFPVIYSNSGFIVYDLQKINTCP